MARLAHSLAVLLAVLCAAVPVADAAPPDLRDVRRHVDLRFDRPVTVHRSAGAHVVWLDVETSADAASRALVPLDGAFDVRVIPLAEGRTRIALRHRRARIRVATGTGDDASWLRVGPESYARVLRRAADRARRPLAVRPRLDERADLWTEAEARLAAGDLAEARKRYERLVQERRARDLVHLRLAHVFVASGHIREARARLGGLVRKLPRTPGAALARIWDHYLATITGEAEPNPDRIEVAVIALGESPHRPFVAWQAALVLGEIGAAERGLPLLPDPRDLPEADRDALARDRTALLVQAIADAGFEGRARDVAALVLAYRSLLMDHPDGFELAAWGVEAALGIGDCRSAEGLARAWLARDLPRVDEARMVGLLGWAEASCRRTDKLEAAVTFLVRFHPDTPGLPALIRVLAAAGLRDAGYAGVRDALRRLADSAASKAIERRLLGLAIDLAIAHDAFDDATGFDARLRRSGYDDDRRKRQRALALAHLGRFADAIPLLRTVVAATTDPELRDALGYLLARCERALGRDADADAILAALSRHGTRWGTIAHLRRRERELQSLLDVAPIPRTLEGATPTQPEEAP